jgi:hypothetical protein
VVAVAEAEWGGKMGAVERGSDPLQRMGSHLQSGLDYQTYQGLRMRTHISRVRRFNGAASDELKHCHAISASLHGAGSSKISHAAYQRMP